MSEYKKRITILIAKMLEGDISFSERQELEYWLRKNHIDGIEDLGARLKHLREAEAEKDREADMQRIMQALTAGEGRRGLNPVRILRRRVMAIAAVVVLALVAGTCLWMFTMQRTKGTMAVHNAPSVPVKDLPPGGNKAILTLANGSTVVLDNAGNGVLAHEGNTRVVKLSNGQLAYNILNEKPSATLYNMVSTPRGGQYQVVLPDGSKVWLNAASRLRFPTAFTGTERDVELSGEAYFEVTRNPSMPFKVKIMSAVRSRGEVRVLGTHFNVNAYEDEAVVKTTLLEGSVRMSSGSNSVLLKPGEQSVLDKTEAINVLKGADIEQAVAWKNGMMVFDNANTEMIMRQIARWYDVKIVYKGAVPNRELTGKISKNVNLSKVLQILDLSDVHCKIEGNTVMVLP